MENGIQDTPSAHDPAPPLQDDQSIEHVLHSIRRILQEEEHGESAPGVHASDTAESAPGAFAREAARAGLAHDMDEADMLTLDRSMLVSAPGSSPTPQDADPRVIDAIQNAARVPDADMTPPDSRPEPDRRPHDANTAGSAAPPEPAPPRSATVNTATTSEGGLMADQTLAATERSLDALHEALSRHERRQTISGDMPVSEGGALTLEGMVRQEVRAMVRTWLDTHLPSLVEIMVRAEISKMSRR